MSNTLLPPKYQGRSLEDLRSSLRAINHRCESIRMDAAVIVGILPLKPGRKIWTADEIQWDDPKLAHLKDTYFELCDTASKLLRHVSELEAKKSGNLSVWKAKQKGEIFLRIHFHSIEEEKEFFEKNNLHRGMSSLTEAILSNPNFLEGVIL
ncbi:hypothetical protein [Methanobrevibacter sp.]|uniref:hypothetical protein n=1 Tax=Methanobrevibacter sp. TaxID=66852 RepID=UPI003890C381